MRSIGLNTRIKPGPFALSSRRPRRKITPRSYSARILIEFSTYKTTITIGTTTNRFTGSLRIAVANLAWRRYSAIRRPAWADAGELERKRSLCPPQAKWIDRRAKRHLADPSLDGS